VLSLISLFFLSLTACFPKIISCYLPISFSVFQRFPGFLAKIWYAFLISTSHLHCQPIVILLISLLREKFWETYHFKNAGTITVITKRATCEVCYSSHVSDPDSRPVVDAK
jgi:hypothetical protein